MTHFDNIILTREQIRAWLSSPVAVSDFGMAINQSAAIIEQLLAEANGNAMVEKSDFRDNIIIKYADETFGIADCEGDIWGRGYKSAQLAIDVINEHMDCLELDDE